jgi:hypothetical protein
MKNDVHSAAALHRSAALPFVISTEAHPDFLYAAPDTTACAAFFKESRMYSANATNLHRKSGVA